MHRENAKLLSFNYHSGIQFVCPCCMLRLSARCSFAAGEHNDWLLPLHTVLASTGAILFYGTLYSYFVFCFRVLCSF